MKKSKPVITETIELDDGVCVVASGDVDLSRSPVLRDELFAIVDRRPGRLVVDLSNVEYMDSSGIATLIEAYKRLDGNQAKMVIFGLQPRVQGIFEIARMDQVFHLAKDLDAAKSV